MTLTIIYILISVLVGSVGQVLLKKGMGDMGPLTLTANQLASMLWRIGTNPYVILGLAIYGGATVLWLVALSRADLSYVYPFASLQYAITLGASWWLFGEHITVWRLLGTVVIGLGVLLVSRS